MSRNSAEPTIYIISCQDVLRPVEDFVSAINLDQLAKVEVGGPV